MVPSHASQCVRQNHFGGNQLKRARDSQHSEAANNRNPKHLQKAPAIKHLHSPTVAAEQELKIQEILPTDLPFGLSKVLPRVSILPWVSKFRDQAASMMPMTVPYAQVAGTPSSSTREAGTDLSRTRVLYCMNSFRPGPIWEYPTFKNCINHLGSSRYSHSGVTNRYVSLFSSVVSNSSLYKLGHWMPCTPHPLSATYPPTHATTGGRGSIMRL